MLCAASLILAVATNQKQLGTFKTAESRLLRKLDATDSAPLVAETCLLPFCPRRKRLPPQPSLQPASFACVCLLVLWHFLKLQLFSCRAKHYGRCRGGRGHHDASPAVKADQNVENKSDCRRRCVLVHFARICTRLWVDLLPVLARYRTQITSQCAFSIRRS